MRKFGNGPTEYVRAYVIHTHVKDSRKNKDRNGNPSNVGFTKARLVKRASVQSNTKALPNVQPTIARIERAMRKRVQDKREVKRKPCAEFNALFKDDCE